MNEYFYGDKRIIEKYYGDMVLYRYEAEEGGVKSYTEHFLGSTIPSSANDFTTETRTLTTSTGSTATVYTGGWYWDGASGIKNRVGNSSLARYKAEYIKFTAKKKTKVVIGVASLPSATSTNRLDIFCSASQLTTTTALNGSTDRMVSITSAVTSLTDYEFEVEAGDYYLTFSHRSQSTSTSYVATIDYVKFEEEKTEEGGGDGETGGSGKYVYQMTVADNNYGSYGVFLSGKGNIEPKELEGSIINGFYTSTSSRIDIITNSPLPADLDFKKIRFDNKIFLTNTTLESNAIYLSISDSDKAEITDYLSSKVDKVVEVELLTDADNDNKAILSFNQSSQQIILGYLGTPDIGIEQGGDLSNKRLFGDFECNLLFFLPYDGDLLLYIGHEGLGSYFKTGDLLKIRFGDMIFDVPFYNSESYSKTNCYVFNVGNSDNDDILNFAMFLIGLMQNNDTIEVEYLGVERA